MRKLLLALLIGGCTATPGVRQSLPTFLTGEWVSPDFSVRNNETEPDAGMVIYIAEDGLSEFYMAPIAGVICKANYNVATRILSLKTVVAPPQQNVPKVTLHFIYDAKTETLTISKTDLESGVGLEAFKRRRGQLLPVWIHNLLAQWRSVGPPFS